MEKWNLLSDNVQILKQQASGTAYQGMGIAISSIIVATLVVSYYQSGGITVDGLIQAQSLNYGLWVLDSIPFVFGFWGQYYSSIIAYQAGAMILDQTQELRSKADSMEQQANHAATHDLVTNLPNRALFYDNVDQAIHSANTQNEMLSILLVEFANFKDVYDTLGRDNTDLILKQMATRLQGLVIGPNSVARIDGNIFGLLITRIENENAGLLFAKTVQEILDPPFTADRLNLAIHSNIGIVNFPEHGENVDSLVQKAGVALFMAGNSHEGCAIYTPSEDTHDPRRLTLMSELRQAIERGQLHVYYQPKILVETGQLYGAEALVRWHHPRHGIVTPDEFIPMAEKTRLIKYLTLWMLEESFKQCAQWHQEGLQLTISVNLSARDLHDPELPDIISSLAETTGIKPAWIMLEITESSIMTDPERSLGIIIRLHEMGYQFSIDDFGTGYSSLSYLKKMPLRELKIDKSFVTDVLQSDNDAVIVKATINLAHNLGLQVTAEGVENKQIVDLLNSYDCDIAQGYYFSKPITHDEFGSWIKDQAIATDQQDSK